MWYIGLEQITFVNIFHLLANLPIVYIILIERYGSFKHSLRYVSVVSYGKKNILLCYNVSHIHIDFYLIPQFKILCIV